MDESIPYRRSVHVILYLLGGAVSNGVYGETVPVFLNPIVRQLVFFCILLVCGKVSTCWSSLSLIFNHNDFQTVLVYL